MSKRTISSWLIVFVFLGIVAGVVGGGLLGGVVGYYATLRGGAAQNAVVSGELTAAQQPQQPLLATNLTVSEQSAITDTVKKAEPAVVTIMSTVQTQSRRFGNGTAVAEGSGVIIDAQGHILTNDHVIDGARDIQVVLNNGNQVTAKLVGADKTNDIAVLQISGTIPAFVPLGDSNSLKLGETVVAIGNPLGNYPGSVTVGIVSGLNRSVDETGSTGMIQTDAAINHGNSGGPLMNLDGQVVGITTLVVRQEINGDIAQGLGFAIPSDLIAGIVKQLIANGPQ